MDKVAGLRRGPFGSSLKKEIFVPKSNYVVYEQHNAIYNNFKTRYYISDKKYNELSNFQLKPGDFIMSGAGTIGCVAQVPLDAMPGVFNQALIRIRLNHDIIDTLFFYHWIKSNKMQKHFTSKNPGSAITNLLPIADVKKIIVHIPSMIEQKHLGKLIEAIDNMITLHQRKLSCYARLQAQYIKLFYNVKGLKTRKLCFTNFSSKITLCKLKDISNYENSNFTSTIPSELIENGSYPIYDANIEIAKINTYAQSTPYISIIKDGAGAGRVDLKPAYTSVIGTMGYILAKPGVDIIYLYYLIKNINFDKYQNGSTIPHVYYKDYKEEQVLLPELPEQIKIGKFLLSLEKNIQYSQKLLEELNTIKSSYLNYMFI